MCAADDTGTPETARWLGARLRKKEKERPRVYDKIHVYTTSSGLSRANGLIELGLIVMSFADSLDVSVRKLTTEFPNLRTQRYRDYQKMQKMLNK